MQKIARTFSDTRSVKSLVLIFAAGLLVGMARELRHAARRKPREVSIKESTNR